MGPLFVLSAEIERRDPSTLRHSRRVTALAHAVAARLRCTAAEVEAIALGGLLHDIGKLAVERDVLMKPGRLDDRELRAIRSHPAAGVRMIRGVRALRAAVPCVLHHHERWDGGGYPHGLAGAAIPRPARILAVADAFDAMTSARPYRRPLSVDCALRELDDCAGSQFDPAASDAFLAVWRAGEIAVTAVRHPSRESRDGRDACDTVLREL